MYSLYVCVRNILVWYKREIMFSASWLMFCYGRCKPKYFECCCLHEFFKKYDVVSRDLNFPHEDFKMNKGS